MTDVLFDDLRDKVARRELLVIAGAGVSISATEGDALASWRGLLLNGVEHCRRVVQPLGADWHDRAKGDINSDDMDDLLVGAEKVASKLGAPRGGEFKSWLRQTVGSLQVKNREVAEALGALGVTLATTNYDSILEEVTGRPAVTWRQGSEVERVLRGADQGILHLHGHWKDSESVVLGIRSYEAVIRDEHAQAMQKVLRATRTLLFVGYGAGLGDPNFGSLLAWSRTLFEGSEYRHYLLARKDEVAATQAKHPREERIFVIPYGERHSDLAPFLRSLVPPARAHGPPSAPSTRVSIGLPTSSRCFGRADEIEDLVAAVLSDPSPPTPILGGPGVGKSTVALVAVHDARVVARYGSRRYFVRCDGVQSRESLASEIGRAVGAPPSPEPETALLHELSRGPSILILDNAETPWEAEGLPVEELLALIAGVPGVAIVATLRGAQRPLKTPWREAIRVRPLELVEARDAFVAIAGEAYRHDSLLDNLINAVDRVPLAVSLIAHQSEGEPNLSGVWARWQAESTAMLARLGGDVRETSLEVSYELSYSSRRMDNSSKTLLSACGELPDGVAHVDLDTISPEGLRASSILRKVGLAFDDADRLRLLAPVREFARRRHPPRPENRLRVMNHYLGLAIKHGDKVGHEGGSEAVRILSSEVVNIESLILLGLAGPSNPDAALLAALMMTSIIRLTGICSPRMLERALEVVETKEKYAGFKDQVSYGLGYVYLSRSKYYKAEPLLLKARDRSRRCGDLQLQANASQVLATLSFRRMELVKAQKLFKETLSLHRRAKDDNGVANCLHSLGTIAQYRLHNSEARKLFNQALSLSRRINDFQVEANCLFDLARLDRGSETNETVRRRYDHACGIFARIADLLGEANCELGLGEIDLEIEQYDDARKHLHAAKAIYQRVGNFRGEANCMLILGVISNQESDFSAAKTLMNESRRLYQEASDPSSVSNVDHLEERIGNKMGISLSAGKWKVRSLEALSEEDLSVPEIVDDHQKKKNPEIEPG